LIVPFPESSLNEEAGKLFMEDYEKYFKIASIYTNVHAVTTQQSEKSEYNVDQLSSSNSFIKNDIKMVDNSTSNNFFNNKSEINNSAYSQVEKGLSTPNNFSNVQNDNYMNYNILRHPKSVNLKSSQSSNINRNAFIENTFPRKLTQIDNNIELNRTEYKSYQKPNISSLPFMKRANFNSSGLNSNLENENNSFNIPTNVNNLNSGNFNMNQTPRSKKDEIKKWLSRI
jgi:hypothetical protein